MTGRDLRLALAGLLAAGLAVTAAVWPSRPHGTTAVAASRALDGAALFQAKGCGSCHASPAAPGRFAIGPDLRVLPALAGGRVAGLDAEAYVRQSVRQPRAFVVQGYEAGRMPTLPVDDQELDALVRYLLG